MMSNIDDIRASNKTLKYKWKWCRVASQRTKQQIAKMTHFQISEAFLDNWTMRLLDGKIIMRLVYLIIIII